MKILIPNATGPTNLGDEAMLEVLLDLVLKLYPQATITIHSSDPELYTTSPYTHKSNLYFWSALQNIPALTKLYRTSLVWILLACAWLFKWKPNPNKNHSEPFSIINDYFESDLIVFVGNGYLRAKPGLRQSLNLIMLWLNYLYARVSQKKTVVMSMGFGPFAYSWQGWFTSRVVNLAEVVGIREKISYAAFKKYLHDEKLIQSADVAFLTPKADKRKKEGKELVIGVSLREWLKPEKQEIFEESVFRSLQTVAKDHPITVIPFVQVFGDKYGTSDYQIIKKLRGRLIKAQISCEKIQQITSVSEAAHAYRNLDLLVGMRMHANIIAASQETPFVAIAYEYKTYGIAETIGMSEYVVDVNTVTYDELTAVVQKAMVSLDETRTHLGKVIPPLQQKLTQTWTKLLS